MNENMNQKIMLEIIETQREYINTLLQEKYYFSEENQLLQQRNRQNELMIDTMKVKYMSYLDDYTKNTMTLVDKIKLMETENTQLKNEIEEEKKKNIPIGIRINDLYEDNDEDNEWEWHTHSENKEKYLTEFLYANRAVDKPTPSFVTIETQTDDEDIHDLEYSETTMNDDSTINENDKTIFPDLSSILQYSDDGLDEYIDKYDSYMFERF